MLVPKLFTTLKGYKFPDFLRDLSAGAVVAIIALPLSIALGVASGVTPGVALYTAIVGCFLVSLLGGSRVQIAGPTGAFVVIIYGIIADYGLDGLMLATAMAGIFMILMGLLKLGSLVKFIPYPITTGFTSGIAVVIFSTQIKDFFGLQIDRTLSNISVDFVRQWGEYFINAPTFNWVAGLIALVSLVILFAWPRFFKRIPGSLVVVILSTLVVYLIQVISGSETPIVETIGSRFHDISLSINFINFKSISMETLSHLIMPAITIAVLGSIESLLSAVVADGMIGGNHRSNMELVANGIANLTVGLTGGIPVTGAIARTAANIKNGGRTPIAGLCSAIILLLLTILLLPLIKLIPMACLAAILVQVAYNMGEWSYFVQFKKIPKSDYFVFIATFLLTIFFNLVVGILVGLVLSTYLFMRRMAVISGTEAVDIDATNEKLNDIPAYEVPKNCYIYEIRGPFFFGAASKFATATAGSYPKNSYVFVKMDRVPAVDATGLNALLRFAKKMQDSDCKVILIGLQKQPAKIIRAEGAIVAIVNSIEEATTWVNENK